ncbi:MAG: hypothetical protein ACLFQS_05610 [Bacteroidales bacterium]
MCNTKFSLFSLLLVFLMFTLPAKANIVEETNNSLNSGHVVNSLHISQQVSLQVPGPKRSIFQRIFGIKKKSKAEKSSTSQRHSSIRPERYSPPPTRSATADEIGKKDYEAPESNSKAPGKFSKTNNHQKSNMSAVQNKRKSPLSVSRRDQHKGLNEWEMGFSFGTSHAITDLGANKGLDLSEFVDYHSSNYNFSGGFFTRIKMNSWFGLKMGIDFLSLSGQAPAYLINENPDLQAHSFTNEIFEFYGRTEFVLPALYRSPLDIWGFVGIGLFFSDATVLDQNDSRLELDQEYSQVQPIIPIGMGISYKINKKIRIGYEFGWRNTIFNYLDGMDSMNVTGTTSGYDQYFLNNLQISFVF